MRDIKSFRFILKCIAVGLLLIGAYDIYSDAKFNDASDVVGTIIKVQKKRTYNYKIGRSHQVITYEYRLDQYERKFTHAQTLNLYGYNYRIGERVQVEYIKTPFGVRSRLVDLEVCKRGVIFCILGFIASLITPEHIQRISNRAG